MTLDYFLKGGPDFIADLVSIGDKSWIAVDFDPAEIAYGVIRILNEFRILTDDDEIENREVLATASLSELISLPETIKSPPHGTIIVAKIKNPADTELQNLDLIRNRFSNHSVIFCGVRVDLEKLSSSCPNIWSFIAGNYIIYDAQEGAMNTEERLNSLRIHFGFDDKHVLNLAKNGQLPSDPAFIEWLTLLGHGGLLWGLT